MRSILHRRPSASFLGTLNTQRRAARARLTAAKTPAGQASSAQTIGRAYGRAAKALRGLELSPYDRGANVALGLALDRSERAYRGLGAATRAADRAAYVNAQRASASAERAVAKAVGDLEPGYEVAG